jgi:hypothetical protein
MWPASQIGCNRAEIEAAAGTDQLMSLKLGGTTLWSSSGPALDEAVTSLSECIDKSAQAFLTCTKAVLKKAVMQSIGTTEIDDRIFGAVLGMQLRLGKLDELLVASKNDRLYRVYFSTSCRQRLLQSIEITRAQLIKENRVAVKDVESKIFGPRKYNTWSSTSHILGHLNFSGFARQTDEMEYKLVSF